MILWVLLAYAAVWVVLLMRPYPVEAQRLETRVQKNEEAVIDIKILLAALTERMNATARDYVLVTNKIDALDAKVGRFLEGLIALFVALVGGLITVLWGLRGRWNTLPARIITD